jgi:hypothetical protein
MAKYFVSYTAVDRAWAEWIGSVLVEEGHEAEVQSWDFLPGNNFVSKMQEALNSADRTIAVLSPEYLKSKFGMAEWAAVFATDPLGADRKLVPVRVKECSVSGLLKAIVYVDLVNLKEEDARQALVKGVLTGYRKANSLSKFPGAVAQVPYPGHAPIEFAFSPPLVLKLPSVSRLSWDPKHEKYAKKSFKIMGDLFHSQEILLTGRNDIFSKRAWADSRQFGSGTKFGFEIKCYDHASVFCSFHLGAPFGEPGFVYVDGLRTVGQILSYEIFRVQDSSQGPALVHVTKSGHGGQDEIKNSKYFPEDAAHYLWQKFLKLFTA